jgi:hypothetical protein
MMAEEKTEAMMEDGHSIKHLHTKYTAKEYRLAEVSLKISSFYAGTKITKHVYIRALYHRRSSRKRRRLT